MLAKVPQLDIKQAASRQIHSDKLESGNVTRGRRAGADGADFAMSAAKGVLQNVSVTVTLRISVEWHVHVGLPDDPDIDIGDTYDLGLVRLLDAGRRYRDPGVEQPELSHPEPDGAEPVRRGSAGRPAIAQCECGANTGGGRGAAGGGLHAGRPDAGDRRGQRDRCPGSAGRPGHGGPPARRPGAGPVVHAQQLQPAGSADPRRQQLDTAEHPGRPAGTIRGFDAGLLRIAIHIAPSVLSHIDHLEITGANAHASVGQIVLRNVTLPYDALNLTLSQIGIDTVSIPGVYCCRRRPPMPDDGARKVIQVPVKRYDVNLTLDQILTPLSEIATRHADGGAASLTATNSLPAAAAVGRPRPPAQGGGGPDRRPGLRPCWHRRPRIFRVRVVARQVGRLRD